MLRSVAPKVASAAAAAAGSIASSSTLNVSQCDFHPNLTNHEVLTRRKSQCSLLSESSEGWNIIHNGSPLPVEDLPTPEETEEATNAVFIALGCESEVASIHSWPDADASMVASERAISVANEALHSSEYNVRVPVPPETALARVIQQLEARPQQTKKLVGALVTDPNVWDAVTNNNEFQVYLKEAFGATGQSLEPDSIKGNHAGEKDEKKDNIPLDKKINGFIDNLLRGLQSFAENFINFFKKMFSAVDNEDNSGSEPSKVYFTIGVLVFLVVGVIFARRIR